MAHSRFSPYLVRIRHQANPGESGLEGVLQVVIDGARHLVVEVFPFEYIDDILESLPNMGEVFLWKALFCNTRHHAPTRW